MDQILHLLLRLHHELVVLHHELVVRHHELLVLHRWHVGWQQLLLRMQIW